MKNLRTLFILADNMRRLRKIKQLTQEELAYRTGLHPYFIGLIERKTKTPSLESIEKISRALHVTPSELLYEQEQKGADVKDAVTLEIAEMIKPLSAKQTESFLGAVKLLVKSLREEKPSAALRAAETGRYHIPKKKKN